jgi:integrase
MSADPKIEVSAMESFEWNGTQMARKRFQRGQLIRSASGWTARYWEDVVDDEGRVIFDKNGKPKRIRPKQFLGTLEDYPTKRLAQRALDDMLAPINKIDYKPLPTISFAVFAKRWMDKVMALHEASSKSSETSIINAQLLPAFGAMRMKDISLESVQSFVAGSPRAPKTVKNIIGVFMLMWNSALEWGYVSHNPFPRGINGRLRLRMPRVVKGNGYRFTLDETLAIIAKAPDRWKIFFRILAETGIRPGELAGLRMSDIGEQRITIERSIWRGTLKTPKTQNGTRTFAVSASLCDAIRALEPGKDGHIYVSAKGKLLSVDHLRIILKPILVELGIAAKLEKLGIDRCGNYAFRRMNMTLQSRSGVPLKTIQKRVGHAPGSDVTMIHYIEAVDSDDIVAAEKMGAMLTQVIQ